VRGRNAAIAVLAGTVLLTGCGHGGSHAKAAPTTIPATTTVTASTTTTTTQDPSAVGLRAAAQVVLAAYSSGQWGVFWDHWDPASQALITRAEYIRRKTACPRITGVPISISAVQPGANGLWNVVGHGIGSAVTYQFRYSQGTWSYVITDPAIKADLVEPYARYIARPGCTK
jgi:hypothetical protein